MSVSIENTILDGDGAPVVGALVVITRFSYVSGIQETFTRTTDIAGHWSCDLEPNIQDDGSTPVPGGGKDHSLPIVQTFDPWQVYDVVEWTTPNYSAAPLRYRIFIPESMDGETINARVLGVGAPQEPGFHDGQWHIGPSKVTVAVSGSVQGQMDHWNLIEGLGIGIAPEVDPDEDNPAEIDLTFRIRHQEGVHAARPTTSLREGDTFFSTDYGGGALWYYTGSVWELHALLNLAKAGAPSDGDYGGSAPVGAIAVDTALGVAYIRMASSWVPIALSPGAVTPGTVTGIGAVPAPTISGAAVVAPATVAGVGAVPTPTVSLATPHPATVAGVGAVPAPTVSGDAIVSLGIAVNMRARAGTNMTIHGEANVAPATVVGTSNIPFPTINVESGDLFIGEGHVGEAMVGV